MSPLRTLLVDRDPTVIEHLESGDDVVATGDLQRAKELLFDALPEEAPFAAVVVDLGLADEMFGALWLTARRRMQGLALLTTSGSQEPRVHERSALLGAAAHVLKPLEREALSSAVERAVRWRRDELEEKLAAERPRILLVDDDDLTRRAIADTLADQGYAVQGVDGVRAALAAARAAYQHIVITDVRMGDLDGMTLASALRWMDEDIAIIIVTGHPNLETARGALEHQVYAYLTKPFAPKELVQVVDRAWEKQQLMAQLALRTEHLARANAELQLAQDALVQNEKHAAIGQVAASVAHDLSQPLNTVKLIAQSRLRSLAREAPDPAELERDLREVVTLIDRGASIIDNIRSFGQRYSEASAVDVNQEIESCLQLVGSKFRKEGIEIHCELVDVPLARAHPGKLRQVLVHVLQNARDALLGREGEPARSIWVNSGSLDGGKVGITLRDNAGGIPEAVRGRVFEAFFTTKPRGEGMGLGLSVSRRLLHEVDGHIDLSVEPDEGTTVSIALPPWE